MSIEGELLEPKEIRKLAGDARSPAPRGVNWDAINQLHPDTRTAEQKRKAAQKAQAAKWLHIPPAERDTKIAARKRAAGALRRAREAERSPEWRDREAIAEVYREAERITRETGIPHDVDHEIPLHGEAVSGLHVHNNLRVIPKLDNIRKGNRYEVKA